MIFLQDAKTRTIGWRMGKHKNLPSFVRGVRLDGIFEPLELFLSNRSGNGGITVRGRSHRMAFSTRTNPPLALVDNAVDEPYQLSLRGSCI